MLKFGTMWNFEHKKPRELSQEPAPLKDDLPFKSLTERMLESQAMGEAYINQQRMRFMMSVDQQDPLDQVGDMDSILTEFDRAEDMGDAQRAYKYYMERKALYERQLAFARAKEAEHQRAQQAAQQPPVKDDK